MMRSDAWRDMSINGRRMLDLLELSNIWRTVAARTEIS